MKYRKYQICWKEIAMRIIKSLVTLLLIVALFGLVGLYALLGGRGEIFNFFQELLQQYEWFYPFLQGTLIVVTIVVFIFFLIVVAKPLIKKNWLLEKETGQINFSPKSLAAIAKASLYELVNPEDIFVKVQMTKKKLVNVEVIISSTNCHQLQLKGQTIQQQIAYALSKMAKLETGKINVVFNTRKTDNLFAANGKHDINIV